MRGFLALENPAGVDARKAIGIREARAVAHQAAHSREIAIWEDRWQRMLERAHGKLLASANEELTPANDEPACSQLDQVCEYWVEVTFGADLQNMELQPETVSSRLHPMCRFFGYSWVSRVNEERENPRGGN